MQVHDETAKTVNSAMDNQIVHIQVIQYGAGQLFHSMPYKFMIPVDVPYTIGSREVIDSSTYSRHSSTSGAYGVNVP